MEYGSFGTTALKLDIGNEYYYLGLGLADLYRRFRDTVGKLVGQYSDSDRVSQPLKTPSRESKKLKSTSLEKRERERERIWLESIHKGRRLAQYP